MVCFDGSNTAKAAFGLAEKHAKAFDAELIVVMSMLKGTENEREEIEKAEKSLAGVKKDCEKNAIPCDTHLLIRGLSAGEDLVEFAGDQHVDQIFIGVKRRSKVEKLVFGSTAQYVILNAESPVVTVK